MTLDQFVHRLDTYGGDFGRWPDNERAAAESLVRFSVEAQQRRLAAQQLDTLLTSELTVPPDPVHARAITEAALRRIRSQPRRTIEWRWLLAQPVAATLACVAVGGWVAGCATAPVFDSPRPPGASAVAVLLGDGGGALREIFR